jgi:hypothetical protein
MPKKRSRPLAHLATVDPSLLKRVARRAAAERHGLFLRDQRDFAEEVKLGSQMARRLGRMLPLSRREREAELEVARKMMRRLIKRGRPPGLEVLRAHNPTRYAPYDASWTDSTPAFLAGSSFFGPDASTGLVGAEMWSAVTGAAVGESLVGFWDFTQPAGTLYVRLAASMYGQAAASAFGGFALAQTDLVVIVQQHTMLGIVKTATNTASIFKLVAPLFGVQTFKIYSNEVKSVTISVPLGRGTLFSIWGGLLQRCGAGGVAAASQSLHCLVGPVLYTIT